LKPTAFGLDIDYKYALKTLSDIVRKANESDIYVRLDMEDSTHTESTLNIMEDLYSEGHLNVGVVLQGRLFRTKDDLLRIAEAMGEHADVRICKGIYLESSDIAYTGYSDIVNATTDAVEIALDLGMYVGIASHDHPIINAALESLQTRGIMPEKSDPRNPAPAVKPGKGGGYEFQFLLGVRGDVRRRLASNGHLTRVYLPYGKQWYEYSMRRLRENPGIAWLVAKSIIMPWTNRR
jgi:proline dehydrogenase